MSAFIAYSLNVLPTGAILGSGLIAPPEPTTTEGRRKSIRPANVAKELSSKAVILASFPTLPHLFSCYEQLSWKDRVKRAAEIEAYDNMMPRTFGASLAISATSSLSKSIPAATGGKL